MESLIYRYIIEVKHELCLRRRTKLSAVALSAHGRRIAFSGGAKTRAYLNPGSLVARDEQPDLQLIHSIDAPAHRVGAAPKKMARVDLPQPAH
jgi:hypothetical protein